MTQYTRSSFRLMAQDNPGELLSVLQLDPPLPPQLLTFAADAVARVCEPTEPMLQALCTLLHSHELPYVREGALYGLAPHIKRPIAKEAIQKTAEWETNRLVRALALLMLGRNAR